MFLMIQDVFTVDTAVSTHLLAILSFGLKTLVRKRYLHPDQAEIISRYDWAVGVHKAPEPKARCNQQSHEQSDRGRDWTRWCPRNSQ